VGESKGGNTNNRRALKVGLRMVVGIVFGWRFLRGPERRMKSYIQSLLSADQTMQWQLLS